MTTVGTMVEQFREHVAGCWVCQQAQATEKTENCPVGRALLAATSAVAVGSRA